ncbi:MAG: M56 family metallopeptidase [Chloroflexi bacterium]|nr:M56 family metallopeptidase [Chloroflexota bacterium]
MSPLLRRADVALALLVALATLAASIALALSERGLEAVLALVVTICRRTLDETLAHGADLGRLLLLVPAGLGLTLAIGEAFRLAVATRRLIANLQLARCEPPQRLRRLARKCELAESALLVCADRPLVFTHGLFNPKVWLSTGLLRALADDELEAVLRHEAHHRHAGDPLKVFAARCLAQGLFFVPIARDLCDAYSTAKEIAADESAVRAMGNALPLVRALRTLIAAETLQRSDIPLAALVSEQNAVEARLLTLLDPARSLPLFPMPRLGLSLFWLLLLLAIVFSPTAGHIPSFAECLAA